MITPPLDVAMSPGAVLLGEGAGAIGGATPAYKLYRKPRVLRSMPPQYWLAYGSSQLNEQSACALSAYF